MVAAWGQRFLPSVVAEAVLRLAQISPWQLQSPVLVVWPKGQEIIHLGVKALVAVPSLAFSKEARQNRAEIE